MATDDPRQLLTDAAEQLRKKYRELLHTGSAHGYREVLLTVADALDPPPKPEPEFPPGTLVATADGCLRITTTDGLLMPGPGLSAFCDEEIHHKATATDVTRYVNDGAAEVVLEGLQDYALFVVSQEKPPELLGDDKEKYVVVEKRIGKAGEWYVSPNSKAILRLYEESALPVWIVKPKEQCHGRQTVTDD